MTDAVLRNCGLAVVLAVAACRHRPQAATDELRDLTRLVHEERYDLALAKTDKGLRRAESSGDLRLKWRFRLLKVEILLGRRMAPQALALLDTYGNPPESPEWAEERGRALLFRGQAAYTEGRLGEAHDLLSRAATAASEAGSPSLSAEVKLRRGTLSAMRGRFDDAHEALQEALGAAKTVHDPYLEARVTSNLGFTFFAESRYAEAISWYERSLGLSERLGAVESVPRADGNLGNCYARLGDYDNAVLHQMRAQDAFAKAGNLYEQQLFLGNSGNNSFAAEDYAAAAAAWERALRIARQVPAPVWIARWLNNLATVSIEREDWNAAERFNSEALALKRKLGLTSDEASSINNAARIAVSRNRFEEAMKLFQEALSLQSEDPTVQLEARSGIAGLFIRSGRPGDASAEFETTLAEIDRRGANLLKDDYKLSYLASLIRFHGQYVDFLMANHQPERALEVAESSRSRVLVGRSGGVPGIERGTSRDYQRLAARANAVLLEFWIGSKQSYLWVVTPEHVTHHVLPSKTALHALIEHYRAVTMADRNTLEIAGDTGTKLYNALLAPAADDAAGKTRFLIVPDDELYSFNFETLPAGPGANKYWIEHATVAIAPSLNYLARTTRNSHSPGKEPKVLLIGDPVSTLPQYPRLEFASREIDSIAAAMPGSETTILKGEAARPDAYAGAQPGRFGFIHFSAHASANAISPLDSAVILSGPPDKCRLLARDVLAQPLTAALVTVSACRSAGGKTYAGEGMIGFAWTFLKAGAGNVIAGLWDVNDRSTTELMSGLYAEIGKGRPIPDALRRAKLNLIHEGGVYAKPFYWAPFELYTGTGTVMAAR